MHSTRVQGMVDLYQDAMQCLKARPMVDPDKAAVFGASYGGSLAIAYAGQTHGLSAILLAYPAPVAPFEYLGLLTGTGAPREWRAGPSRTSLPRGARQGRAKIPDQRGALLPSLRSSRLPRPGQVDLRPHSRRNGLGEDGRVSEGSALSAAPKASESPRAAVAAPSPGPSAKSSWRRTPGSPQRPHVRREDPQTSEGIPEAVSMSSFAARVNRIAFARFPFNWNVPSTIAFNGSTS